MKYEYGDLVANNRGTLIEVHLADLHFGAFNPQTQYNILIEQVINPIMQLPKLDVFAIDGDFFDHKVMSNSDVAMYATMFAQVFVDVCRVKGATGIILAGTFSHDADQLKLFYHYMNEKDVDIRIITSMQFENIKGVRVLCIPELYGVDESIYNHFFFESGWYDEAYIHGTFKGAVYGDNVGQGRLLTPEDFIYCKGLAISGHVHKSGCFNSFFYYCGCPYRWKFGEEEEKGFLMVAHDLDTQIHHVQFESITSFRYDTITLDKLVSEDPKQIIDYINNLQKTKGIDFIKVKFTSPIKDYNKTIINNYYRNNPKAFVEFLSQEEIQKQNQIESMKLNDQYSYLVDDSISDFERFVKYVNDCEGTQFITVDKLKELLSDGL